VRARLEIGFHKIKNGLVTANLVFLLDEPVAFVLKDHIVYRNTPGSHGLYNLVRFHLQHAGVIGTLEHHQGFDNVLPVEQGRLGPQEFPILKVTHFLLQGLTVRLPLGGNALQGTHPIGNAKNINPHIEDIGPKGQSSQHHVAAIAATDDANALGIMVVTLNHLIISDLDFYRYTGWETKRLKKLIVIEYLRNEFHRLLMYLDC
jgi:hypothetical protein